MDMCIPRDLISPCLLFILVCNEIRENCSTRKLITAKIILELFLVRKYGFHMNVYENTACICCTNPNATFKTSVVYPSSKQMSFRSGMPCPFSVQLALIQKYYFLRGA